MLLTFVAVITPGSGLIYVVYRLIRSRELVSVARVDAARTKVRMNAAQEMGEFAHGALEQTRDALAVDQAIELVDQKATELTRYLVNRIDGTGSAATRRPTRRAEPGADELAAITSGLLEEISGLLGDEDKQS